MNIFIIIEVYVENKLPQTLSILSLYQWSVKGEGEAKSIAVDVTWDLKVTPRIDHSILGGNPHRYEEVSLQNHPLWGDLCVTHTKIFTLWLLLSLLLLLGYRHDHKAKQGTLCLWENNAECHLMTRKHNWSTSKSHDAIYIKWHSSMVHCFSLSQHWNATLRLV